MIPVRRLNACGLVAFLGWLESASPGGDASALLLDPSLTEEFNDCSIDPDRKFASRYEFGSYLQTIFGEIDRSFLLSAECDGLWAWICGLYFAQLAPVETRRSEHYIPTRKGSAGSLLHRNAARTAFELVSIHGDSARFALQQTMDKHGQLLESLSASQSVVRNKGFFAAASRLYVRQDGTIKRGASSKPKKPGQRVPGELSGRGSIRRLPLALRRLDLTYDVEVLNAEELVGLLPVEYKRWTAEKKGKSKE